MVLFLHEFCSLAKSLQMVQQLQFLWDLATESIFDIITDVLKYQDRKLVSIGTNILILFLNQDPNILRLRVIQQEGNALLSLLVKGLQKDTIIGIFFKKHLDQLIDVITSSCPSRNSSHGAQKSIVYGGRGEYNSASKVEILSHICELLRFCVHNHTYNIRCNFLESNAIEKVLCLTLVVAVVRRLDQQSREFKAVEVNNCNHSDKTNVHELSPSGPCPWQSQDFYLRGINF
ncbi:hypothetical protein IEQ34_005648 [Dendrobium chrysotoxum]|uniref:Serine/threonine-protein phosphatase 4 regulatory subunit 3-like central domain-containing protein n=1 Tax=Dendrobium chrysotoxum TaxID=161865 RepID=A0AAV7HDL7_DENCH|nr:hypothetical protein IEQ34_005648 [Dendrobium chrysotoxum]